jgi:teichuronic acid biosynthesis glycosyltransferase TuaC
VYAPGGNVEQPSEREGGRALRVLFVIPGRPEGSSMVFSRNEVRRLQGAGVVGKVFFLDRQRRSFVEVVRELRRAAAEFRPDAIHAHFGSLTAFVCALLWRIPLIITYRGSDLNKSPADGVLRSTAQRVLSQLASLRAKAIICVSDQLRERLWWRSRRAVVIPSGVDLDIFRPTPRDEARRALGWREDESVVLFNAGVQAAVKRLDLASDAVRVAERTLRSIRFHVLRGGVRQEDIPLLMSASDCLLVTSDNEGSPDIVKEALACNLPIVSVDVGDVAQRLLGVSHSEIAGRNPDALGAALIRILSENARSNGRAQAEKLAAPRVTEAILKVYDDALRVPDKRG